jgi:transposase
MWTRETRAEHYRDDLRYPSDPDRRGVVLSPVLPPPAQTGHFPPHQTTYRWFMRFRDDGTWKRLNHHLVMLDRVRAGREAGPTAAVIDTQSVKTTEAGGRRGYDAAKKINGRKRHALVDTDGRCLELQVQSTSVQDRDGAPAVLQAARTRFPFVQKVFADSVYAGEKVANATSIVVEIVRKLADQVGFQVYHAAGSSSASSPGSTATVASPRISRPRSPRPQPSSTPLALCC